MYRFLISLPLPWKVPLNPPLLLPMGFQPLPVL